MRFQNLTLPAQELAVLDGPAPLEEAFAQRDASGHFTAVIAVDADTLVAGRLTSPGGRPDVLASLLTTHGEAFDCTWQVLGASADGTVCYLRVSNNVVALLRKRPHLLDEVGLDASELIEQAPCPGCGIPRREGAPCGARHTPWQRLVLRFATPKHECRRYLTHATQVPEEYRELCICGVLYERYDYDDDDYWGGTATYLGWQPVSPVSGSVTG